MPAQGEMKRGRAGMAAANGPDSPREVELKLLVPPGALDHIRNAPIIAQRARNKGIVRRLEAIYYDTPDHLLVREGLTLRVRRSGKQHIQTVKCASGNGPLARHEWEAPVATIVPDLACLPKAEIGAPFDTLSAEALVPMFSTKVRRHLQTLVLPDAVVEVAFDDGAIAVDGRDEPLCEVELELKSGDVGALYEIGLSLIDIAPLRVGTQSKAERGYALAFDKQSGAAKASPAGLDGSDTVDEGIAKLLASCRDHLMANLAAAESGQDRDGVHQMRVALRRLRSVLSILRREVPAPSLQALANDAKLLARILGPARSWDVFIATTLSEIEDAALADVDLSGLQKAAEPFREASYAAVREALADPQHNRFLLSLGRVIERRSWRNDIPSETLATLSQPISALADRALAQILRKARKRGRHFQQLDPESRHKLRLNLKKLRYAVEFFQPLYRERTLAAKYLKRLTRLQDVLGADNDVTTTRPLLQEVAGSTTKPDLHRAIGTVAGWQGHHQIEAAKLLRQRWRRFTKAAPFWTH